MRDIANYLTPEGTPERCGIVTLDGEIVELSNVHEKPEIGFRMSASEILTHFSDAAATWHTHPGADPNLSEEDYAGFSQWPQLEHHIAGIRDGEVCVVTYAFVDNALVMK